MFEVGQRLSELMDDVVINVESVHFAQERCGGDTADRVLRC